MIKTTRFGDWSQLIVPNEWEGQSIDSIFRHVWEAPKKLTHSYRMEKKVRVDGNEQNWNLPLRAGSKLQIKMFAEEPVGIVPAFAELDIQYEDDHLLVINKPPFLTTHPNNPELETNSLINAVAFYLITKGESGNVHQIHRLDRDTSGAILFAKHALAAAILANKLEKREIKRTYIAKVDGLFIQKQGSINEPIGRDRHHPTRRRVSHTGQEAITHYRVIKEEKPNQISYVKCWLETGRTHQIRVHLAHIGHPLIGDILYGGKPLANRQALHAAKLEFIHPFSREKVECHAPFTDDPPIFKNIDIYSV